MKIERGSWSLPISWLKPSCHMRFQPAFTACVCVFSNKLCWFEPTNRFTLKTQQDAVKILWNTRVATCLKGIYVIIIVFSMGNNVEPRFSYSTQKKLLCFCFLTISTNNANKNDLRSNLPEVLCCSMKDNGIISSNIKAKKSSGNSDPKLKIQNRTFHWRDEFVETISNIDMTKGLFVRLLLFI